MNAGWANDFQINVALSRNRSRKAAFEMLVTGESIAAACADTAKIVACNNMMDPNALEGVRAFIDKRPPDWKHT